jgi:hypothetical protein
MIVTIASITPGRAAPFAIFGATDFLTDFFAFDLVAIFKKLPNNGTWRQR